MTNNDDLRFAISDKREIHIPVLLKEVLEHLNPSEGEFIIDGTINGGGHSSEILERLGNTGKLLGIDWDNALAQKAKEKFKNHKNVQVIQGNFADLEEILARLKLDKADGLLLDLGFSSFQIDEEGRGFSFLRDEPLEMTYDRTRTPLSSILRGLEEKELADIIYNYAGERHSRKIASAIKGALRKKKIETTGELVEVIKTVLPKSYERGRIDPATRTFQALRIYANDEFENIKKVIEKLPQILRPGGRAVILTFHSLEDRIVKEGFKALEKQKTAVLLTKKPIPATFEESKNNPRSRSAKLRAIQLISPLSS